jgi:membrane-bound ClpP family serine protease
MRKRLLRRILLAVFWTILLAVNWLVLVADLVVSDNWVPGIIIGAVMMCGWEDWSQQRRRLGVPLVVTAYALLFTAWVAMLGAAGAVVRLIGWIVSGLSS